MLVIGSLVQKTHYEVLSVKEDASYDEIRASYKAAILNSHPDKLNSKTEAPGRLHEQQDKFLGVQKAWEVLCDPKSRENYDKVLQASRQELEIAANEVKMRDMIMEIDGDVQEFFYSCRCGDYFSVTSVELREMGIFLDGEGEIQVSTDMVPASVLLPCGSCSLKIRLVIDSNC